MSGFRDLSLHGDLRWSLHMPNEPDLFAQCDMSRPADMRRDDDVRSGHMPHNCGHLRRTKHLSRTGHLRSLADVLGYAYLPRIGDLRRHEHVYDADVRR